MSLLIRTFLALVLVGISSVKATTKVNLPTTHNQAAQDAPNPFCEVEAKFIEETYDLLLQETKVSWVFEIHSKKSNDGGVCPKGPRFRLAIRDGQFVKDRDGTGRYVYGVDVVAPEVNRTVVLQVRLIKGKNPRTKKKYQEWLLTDGFDGIKVKSN